MFSLNNKKNVIYEKICKANNFFITLLYSNFSGVTKKEMDVHGENILFILGYFLNSDYIKCMKL